MSESFYRSGKISVRPTREFQEMLVTDINARTNPITDTDIIYEGHSVAVRSTSYVVLPPTFHLPDTRLLYGNWLVALACGLPAFTRGLLK